MDTNTIIILVLLCIGASIIQRVSGFGFGIFIMTALPYIMPSYGEATTLSGILSAAQSILIVIKMRNYVSWKRMFPILITFIISSFFAVRFVTMIDDKILKHTLGFILIIASIYFFFSEKIHVKTTLPIQLSLGTLSGIMGGMCAMQGPPAVLYFVSSEPTKENYLAMTQVFFFIGNIVMTIYRANNGMLTDTVWTAWIYSFAGIFIGSSIGKILFDRISGELLKKIIYAYMAIAGIITVMA